MFKQLSRLVLVSQLLYAMSANALLTPGAVAPDFTAEAALAGQSFSYSLSEALKKGPVVLYFYPKAFTSGCTVQAHLFSRASQDFNALGATIIGVSNDSLETQKQFSLKECGSTLPVAADPDGNVVRLYDASMAFGSATSKRVTYVIAPDGKILYAYSDVNPKEHVNKSLDVVKRWKASQQPASQ